MMRTRLVWFAVGFSVSGVAIGQFIWRDLWAHRRSLSIEAHKTFDALETRVEELESVSPQN